MFVFNSFPNNKRLKNSLLLLLGVKKRQEIFREREKRRVCVACVSLAGLLFEMMMDACSRVVFFFFFEVKREKILKMRRKRM